MHKDAPLPTKRRRRHHSTMATFGDVKIKLEEQPESEATRPEDDDDGMIKGRCYVPPGAGKTKITSATSSRAPSSCLID